MPLTLRASTTDALLGMLLPFWQLVLGVVILAVCVIATFQLVRRGRSRMRFAVLVAGAAVVGVSTLSFLLDH